MGHIQGYDVLRGRSRPLGLGQFLLNIGLIITNPWPSGLERLRRSRPLGLGSVLTEYRLNITDSRPSGLERLKTLEAAWPGGTLSTSSPKDGSSPGL